MAPADGDKVVHPRRAPPPVIRLSHTDPFDDARTAIARRVLVVATAVFGLAALLLATGPFPIANRTALTSSFGAAALLSLLATRIRGAAVQWAALGVNVLAVTLFALYAAFSGLGLNAPAIGFMTLLPMAICAAVGTRFGAITAAASAVLLLALAWAEQRGSIAGAALLPDLGLERRLFNHLLVLGAGLACGVMISRVLLLHRRASEEREARFVHLLGIAVDTYWEIDAALQSTTVWRRGRDNRFALVDRRYPAPWEMPEWQTDAELFKAHRADLAAQRPFRDLHTQWRRRDGSTRHQLISGEPRVDAFGRFAGYWGVGRDITELHDAQEALRRSQTTLSHLVATSPDLITLTEFDSGRYVMVNDTFTRFTGYTREQAVGHTAVELGIWVEPHERAAFVDAVRTRGTVSDWPQEFVARHGERFQLMLSAAQFDLEGKRFLVLNGRDISEVERTRLAHEAVLQNASLGIAFTRDQHFVQANPAIEAMLGWGRGTLVGQPGRAVWADDAEYAEVGRLIGPRLALGEPVELVHELTRRDGTRFWCRMLAKAVDPSHPMRGGTIWIVEDITERRRTDQALAKARDDAEAANRAKSAFLANTSHEIRTPLNGLVGLARLARRPEVDEARRRQYLEQIGDSAETLTAVISDVLDLSKIEAGKLLIDQITFDLGSLFDSLGRVYGTLADARGLAYRQSVDPALPRRVMGDPVRLRQILTNYLNNALKFTQRGDIALTATAPRPGWLRIEVSDTGPGIEPDVQRQLFTPFTQADQSTTRRFGGSGLGLSICRELASLMRGGVGVDSTPGRGSCFWAELPLDDALTHAQDTAFGDDGQPDALCGARVLMAEDNAVNMTIAVAMLEQWGAIVSQAGDGAQALEAVAQAVRAGTPFDAVLMDVQMPAMSGYEVTRLLRERHDAQTLPIIALTAAALTSERELALAAGMNDFLTKPIDAQRLRDTLVATLDARRARQTAE